MEYAISKFHLTFSYSLGVVLLVTFCGPTNALKCYTNGPVEYIRTDKGKIGLTECTTSGSECYEALADPNYVSAEAVYKSGCGGCPAWKGFHTFECKKCSTDLCNNQFADIVRKTYRLCYLALEEEDFGKKSYYCTKDVNQCYVTSYVNAINRVRYFIAGCGQYERCEGKWKSDRCQYCHSNLCNIPPDLVDEMKPHREQLLQRVAQGWSAEPGQNPASQPAAVAPKSPVSSQANLEWLKNPPQPPPTQPPPSSNQGSNNASDKRTVTDTEILEEDDKDENAATRLVSGRGKGKNKTASERAEKTKIDLDNGGAASVRRVADVFDWRLQATVTASLLAAAAMEMLAL